MVDKYDEDLYENPFFISLQSRFLQLHETATANCWTVSHWHLKIWILGL